MEISEYQPPPPRPSPPAKPLRKFRSVVIISAIFLGSFVVCLAVLNRHELPPLVAQHTAKVTKPDMRQSKLPPDSATAKAVPQAGQQTQAAPPSVFQ